VRGVDLAAKPERAEHRDEVTFWLLDGAFRGRVLQPAAGRLLLTSAVRPVRGTRMPPRLPRTASPGRLGTASLFPR